MKVHHSLENTIQTLQIKPTRNTENRHSQNPVQILGKTQSKTKSFQLTFSIALGFRGIESRVKQRRGCGS